MKIEGLVGRTLRARPSGVGADMGLAARAGFLRPCPDGWILLPMGMRVLDRMARALIGGLECQPVSLPSRRFENSGRTLSELMQGETQSYRHLPLRIATLWRGEADALMPSTQAEAHPWLGGTGGLPQPEGFEPAGLGSLGGIEGGIRDRHWGIEGGHCTWASRPQPCAELCCMRVGVCPGGGPVCAGAVGSRRARRAGTRAHAGGVDDPGTRRDPRY
jgi:hypothetical protein